MGCGSSTAADATEVTVQARARPTEIEERSKGKDKKKAKAKANADAGGSDADDGSVEDDAEVDDDLDSELGLDDAWETRDDIREQRAAAAGGEGTSGGAEAEGEDGEMVFGMVTEAEGEKTLAIRPWMGAVVPPSDYDPRDDVTEVAAELTLERVFGYRGHDVRNNLHVAADGSAVYTVAGIAVARSPDGGQTYYKGHTDDVISIAMHPSGTIFATGQVGRRAPIHVWSMEVAGPNEFKCMSVLNFHERGVNALAFSPDGKTLASVGIDNEHTLAVWDWEREKKITSTKGHSQKVLSVRFNPTNGEIVTCGVKHVTFWTLEGKKLTSKRGLFGRVGPQTHSLGIAFTARGDAVTGTQKGDLYLWRGRELRVKVEAHAGPVLAMAETAEGIISGGKDGTIKMWTPSLECAREVDMSAFSTRPGARVKSVAINGDGNIVTGLSVGEIWEVHDDGADVLEQGHFGGELWGMAPHPSAAQFATAGEDRMVAVWSAETYECVRSSMMERPLRSVAYSPDATLLAVGTVEGTVYLLDAGTLAVRKTLKEPKRTVAELKFSPDGTKLAVGGHDNVIHMYDVVRGKRVGTSEAHSSAIRHIDWSADSTHIQSVCQAYELLFHSVDGRNMTQVTDASSLRDMEWETWTAILGFPVQGIWPRRTHDMTDVNSVDRSKDHSILATADDFGAVILHPYPCVVNSGPRPAYTGHSAHVTKVRFGHDDTYLLSSGGADHAVFQWRVTN